MNIGDRVRLLHGNEEGVITKISSGGRMEIEIEDGFQIPAMKNEVVLVSASEKQYFGGGKTSEISTPTMSTKPGSSKEEGLFLAYFPINDKDHSIYLINATDRDYIVLVSEIYGPNSKTLLAGELSAKSSQKVSEKSIADFEDWPPLLTQFFPIHKTTEKTQPSFERRLKFKASAFFKSKGRAPLLDKNGYVFSMMDQTKEIDIRKLNEELNSENSQNTERYPYQRPAREIDLHIEKLTPDHEKMSNSEMLKLQMETFEKNLDNAIASGMDEITFIHGIGNGVLSKEIHKYLSGLGNIKYFQDTQKSRFGYGATLVRIS
jgi:DNA-nicking Smr family endonuclease